jgi:hypothetical protein
MTRAFTREQPVTGSGMHSLPGSSIRTHQAFARLSINSDTGRPNHHHGSLYTRRKMVYRLVVAMIITTSTTSRDMEPLCSLGSGRYLQPTIVTGSLYTPTTTFRGPSWRHPTDSGVCTMGKYWSQISPGLRDLRTTTGKIRSPHGQAASDLSRVLLLRRTRQHLLLYPTFR